MGVELILPFVGGLIYGSFLNVVVFRFDHWLSILHGRSECPGCKQTLAWYDLVPVVSYVTLAGKCRYCRAPISYQYPAVEIVTGILLAAGYWLIFGTDLTLFTQVAAYIFYIVAVGSMVVIFCHDAYEMMIPDSLSYVLIVAAACFSWLLHQDIIATFYGGLAAVLPIALLVYPSRGKWMGEGDVKLAIGLGLLVGYPNAIVLLISAFFIGAIYGVLLLAATKRYGLKSAVPFGPFLVIGALIALFYGSSLVHWYKGMLGF